MIILLDLGIENTSLSLEKSAHYNQVKIKTQALDIYFNFDVYCPRCEINF